MEKNSIKKICKVNDEMMIKSMEHVITKINNRLEFYEKINENKEIMNLFGIVINNKEVELLKDKRDELEIKLGYKWI